jgi:hypothetical protein
MGENGTEGGLFWLFLRMSFWLIEEECVECMARVWLVFGLSNGAVSRAQIVVLNTELCDERTMSVTFNP